MGDGPGRRPDVAPIQRDREGEGVSGGPYCDLAEAAAEYWRLLKAQALDGEPGLFGEMVYHWAARRCFLDAHRAAVHREWVLSH